MKKRILTLFSALLLIVMLFTLTGCGENKENTNQEEQGENVVQEVADTVKLNDELNEVCGFAQEIQGNQYKIVALKTEGEPIDITKLGSTMYETLDYSSGKIYLQKENNFYAIDLTKGNGSYTVEKVFTYDMKYTSYYKQMGVYDGKIYFEEYQGPLYAYDIATGKTETIIDTEEIVHFYVNKINGKIYYVERNPGCNFKEYDIATKEIKEIDSASNEMIGSRQYYYNIGLLSANAENIIYNKEEKIDGVRDTNYYLYNMASGKKTKLDSTFMGGIYTDGKLYYEVTSGGDMMYPNYVLKVNSNGTDTVVMEEQKNDFIDFYDLGNGKVQAVMSWGQDITTAGEQAYVIDKETLAVEKANHRYDLVYLIQEPDKKVLNIEQTTNVATITPEQANEIIKQKWRTTTTEEDPSVTEETGLTIVGGYSDIKVKDSNGLEYYVFSYYSRPEGGNLSHIQTMLISVDGKKYKLLFTGPSFQDGDIVTQFDEEGDL